MIVVSKVQCYIEEIIKMIIKKTSSEQFHSFYVKTCRQKGIKPRDIVFYREIANGFIKFLVEKVFEGYEVQLSQNNSLGTLEIVGSKSKVRIGESGEVKGLAVDYKRTKELWEKNPKAKEEGRRIYHTNDHTQNIRYRFRWKMNKMNNKHKRLYGIIMSRANKRRVKQEILKGRQYLILRGRY